MPDLVMNVPSWRSAASRLVVLLSGLTLLLTSLGGSSPVQGATELGQRINATRSGQLGAETAMRKADRQVARAQAQKKAAKKSYKKAKRSVKRTGKRRARAARDAARALSEYKAATAARQKAADEGTQQTISKLKVSRLRKHMRKTRHTWRAVHRKYGRLVKLRWQRRQAIGAARNRQRAAMGQRENAEAVLRGRIASMTALARARVANMIGTSLTRDGSGFSWPTTGRISGAFGCTNSSFYPRRGSCAHFRDGIDIANVPGTPIRAVADGVVAFVGWNPSDERGRAFIVVIVHPGGLVSRYGHMLPGRKVKAGQLVRQGEIIARMGSTGFSTGSHLHIELLLGSTPVNPASYLPAYGTPLPQVKSAAKAKKQAKSKRQAQAKRQTRKARSKQARRREAASAARAAARLADRDAATQRCTVVESETASTSGSGEALGFTSGDLTAIVEIGATGAQPPFDVVLDEGLACEARTDTLATDGTPASESALAASATTATPDKVRDETVATAGPSAPRRSTSPVPQ